MAFEAIVLQLEIEFVCYGTIFFNFISAPEATNLKPAFQFNALSLHKLSQ